MAKDSLLILMTHYACPESKHEYHDDARTFNTLDTYLDLLRN
ncbi:hypothetical protein EV11_0241 [Prochlorococcus sp. SS52]|nr:hypothetical protein EV04_0152 [Prochlorococcus marinus str. LG]KGG24555.1 hypothetical protein EV09_0186 [Prochlorococcus marinus str. SS35]KGG33450.1 hypothetical protein EV10_0658 [Prochlorococcus marinus str. SS51]KGG37366.1 hypothetical protein EV11_0241 [Prochlorococcus sp. SS52]